MSTVRPAGYRRSDPDPTAISWAGALLTVGHENSWLRAYELVK